MESGEDPADGLLGVVLHVSHVRGDGVGAELFDHAPEFGDALLVGGDLGAQVGEVGLRVAGGVRGGGEQLARLVLAEPAVAYQQPVVEQHAFLVDGTAEGGHGAGVMPPISAWCPREATRKRSRGRSPPVSSKTGVTTVTSGK